LDGTLVDTVPDLAAALNRLMAARSMAAFDRAQVAAMVGDGVAALVAKAFAARGCPPDDTAVHDFTADYEAHVAVESRLYPGVAAQLTALADQGWQLAVCTNKPERAARQLLRVLGLLPLVGAIGAGDSFPVRKPDPGHLLATLALLPASAARALMLGDHGNDVKAAAGAGIACIFAAWGYGAPGMEAGSAAVARDIAEAAAIASRLLAATVPP
jgi:phosphoglycolate phosphatase